MKKHLGILFIFMSMAMSIHWPLAHAMGDTGPFSVLEDSYFEQTPNGKRTCCAFGYDHRPPYIPFFRVLSSLVSPADLTQGHNYGGGFSEPVGQIYSCKGGFLDMAHLRETADWTAFIATQIKEKAREGGLVRLADEGTKSVWLQFHPLGKEVTDEIIILVAQRAAYEYTLWHEIATWYDWSSFQPFYSERLSAFSPEDLYSNLLGTYVAAEALRSNGQLFDYNQAMDHAISKLIGELGFQTMEVTKEAFDLIDGTTPDKWWDSSRKLGEFELVRKRFFGNRHSLTPWEVEELGACEYMEELPLKTLPLPSHDSQSRKLKDYYTLSVEVDEEEIPGFHWPQSIKNTIVSSSYFYDLAERFKKEAIKDFGPEVVRPK